MNFKINNKKFLIIEQNKKININNKQSFKILLIYDDRKKKKLIKWYIGINLRFLTFISFESLEVIINHWNSLP